MSDRRSGPAIQGLLFDFGGTLDGEGVHWFDRFQRAYAEARLEIAPEAFRGAYVLAEREIAARGSLSGSSFREMLRLQIGLQAKHLGPEASREVERVVEICHRAAAECLGRSRGLLQGLRERGLRLGIVSNFPGNLRGVCQEFGLAELLDVLLDSTVEGISKPDPRLFERAGERLGLVPGACFVVGDSLERDIVPARSAGFRTVWLVEPERAHARHPAADIVLHRLSALTEHLG